MGDGVDWPVRNSPTGKGFRVCILEIGEAGTEPKIKRVNLQRSGHTTTTVRTQGAGSKPTKSFRLVALMIDCCFISFNRILRRPRGGIRPCAVHLFYKTDRISPRMKDPSSVLIWIIREGCAISTSSKDGRRRKEGRVVEDR